MTLTGQRTENMQPQAGMGTVIMMKSQKSAVTTNRKAAVMARNILHRHRHQAVTQMIQGIPGPRDAKAEVVAEEAEVRLPLRADTVKIRLVAPSPRVMRAIG